MKNLRLNLSVNETNLILEGLGQMPYARVFDLVENLQKQAAQELKEDVAEITAEDEDQTHPAETENTIAAVS